MAISFRAVIFDMDGLLIDTERVYTGALLDTAAALGFHLSEELRLKMIGMPGRDCDALIAAAMGEDFSVTEYRRCYAAEVGRRLEAGIPVKAGVVELLDYLEGSGIPRAVATSSARQTADAHLARCGLRHRFQAIATRDDVVRGKPHPDVFLKAAAALDVTPEDCVALEDSFNGIRAAHAAGMLPIMVPDLLPPTEEMRALCAAVAKDLHAVKRLLARDPSPATPDDETLTS